ncbi:hypothetical protein ACFWXE_23880 [[Kitasatospora] papulosa]|uniref:hypothetical protein n=1 Tax=[Kitasatospora] papulosa TaxID=1464011 RepID=UPI003696A968
MSAPFPQSVPTHTDPPASVELNGNSTPFTRLEEAGLVRTPAESAYGDENDPSARQRELQSRAHVLRLWEVEAAFEEKPAVGTEGLRAEIDFETEYVLHVHEGGLWTRPKDAENRTLHGIDVWHAIRRSRHYAVDVHVFEHGVLLLANATAALRCIPADTYAEYFCAGEDCDDYSADCEGWEGLCGNCADRAYTAEASAPS